MSALIIFRLPKRQRRNHIHSCRRQEAAEAFGRSLSEMRYCYECFRWFEPKPWDEHCQEHLSSLKSLRCEAATYLHTLIIPGFCPFCLGDKLLSPSSRMRSWSRSTELRRHLEGHIVAASWPLTCPHPRCSAELKSETSFRYHLSDVHDILNSIWLRPREQYSLEHELKSPASTRNLEDTSSDDTSSQQEGRWCAPYAGAKVKVKERSSSPSEKAEYTFLNLGFEAFEPKPRSRDTPPLSVISTGVETPATSAPESTTPTSVQGDQATAQELVLPSLNPDPSEQSTSSPALRGSVLPCPPDSESLRLEAEKTRVAADEVVPRSSSRIGQKRKTWEEWKADRYDSDEERQLEDAQYEKELQALVDTGGNAPPEWATDPEMQHMTRTTRAMARKLKDVRSQPISDTTVLRPFKSEQDKGHCVTRNSKRKRQKGDGGTGKRKRPTTRKPEQPIFDCIVLRPLD